MIPHLLLAAVLLLLYWPAQAGAADNAGDVCRAVRQMDPGEAGDLRNQLWLKLQILAEQRKRLKAEIEKDKRAYRKLYQEKIGEWQSRLRSNDRQSEDLERERDNMIRTVIDLNSQFYSASEQCTAIENRARRFMQLSSRVRAINLAGGVTREIDLRFAFESATSVLGVPVSGIDDLSREAASINRSMRECHRRRGTLEEASSTADKALDKINDRLAKALGRQSRDREQWQRNRARVEASRNAIMQKEARKNQLNAEFGEMEALFLTVEDCFEAASATGTASAGEGGPWSARGKFTWYCKSNDPRQRLYNDPSVRLPMDISGSGNSVEISISSRGAFTTIVPSFRPIRATGSLQGTKLTGVNADMGGGVRMEFSGNLFDRGAAGKKGGRGTWRLSGAKRCTGGKWEARN